ncbi:MAG: carboxypeptidase [Desulfobacterales bacterium]|nr:carboxypeptidase [Desulfobacterales bacterium]
MNLFDVKIIAESLADLRVLDKFALDLQRQTSWQEDRDRFSVKGILNEEQIEELRGSHYEVLVLDDFAGLDERRTRDIPTMNRFAAAPAMADMAPLAIRGYLTADEVEEALKNMSNEDPDLVSLIELPNKSWEERTSHAVRIGAGGNPDRKAVLFTGSMHAREWGGSDICMSFLINLLNAYKNDAPVQFGGKVFSADQIQTIFEKIYMFVFPDVNPDGKNYSQTVELMWRKNRNPNSNVDPNHPGVDLNRNFDLLWNSGIGTVSNPASNVYKGESPFSEPETRNVLYMFDHYPNIRYYVDIHSYSELILHSWGHENNQSTDPNQNFRNPEFDGQRANLEYPYREFISPVDQIVTVGVADSLNNALSAVRGRSYKVQQGVGLYPTTGTSSDYAYSRHQANISQAEIMGFTFEFGEEFVPRYGEMRKIIRDVNSAMTELCWIASSDV